MMNDCPKTWPKATASADHLRDWYWVLRRKIAIFAAVTRALQQIFSKADVTMTTC